MKAKRVLIAGIGNVFYGDDGFGLQVAQRLAAQALPQDTRVLEVGIRGDQLVLELMQPLDTLLVVGAVARGGRPGTLYLVESGLDTTVVATCGHGLDLHGVFVAVRELGGALPRTVVIGCEPRTFAGPGLSPAVAQALEPAVRIVRRQFVTRRASSRRSAASVASRGARMA